MDLLSLLIVGALAGWLASKIMNTDAEQGAVMNIILGVIGALMGGFVMNLFGASGVTGFNIYSILVAIVGAVIVIALARTFLYR